MSDLENGTKLMDKQAKRRAAQKAWRERNPGYHKTYMAEVKAGKRVRKARMASGMSGADSSILGTSTQAVGGIPHDD